MTRYTSLGKAFTRQIHNKEAEYHQLSNKGKQPEQGRAQWIGKEAEKAWFAQDLKRHCGTTTLRDDDPISAVSNIGNPRRTDAVASVGGEVVQFELKKSQYHSSRVPINWERNCSIWASERMVRRSSACSMARKVESWFTPAKTPRRLSTLR